ncbi:MAG: hypothetical protein PHC34_02530 [Candidatus Gastranaerophilales bacterium]|nr:hypothetical protein [Candidatus Gastranaerophilales bacterium]
MEVRKLANKKVKSFRVIESKKPNKPRLRGFPLAFILSLTIYLVSVLLVSVIFYLLSISLGHSINFVSIFKLISGYVALVYVIVGLLMMIYIVFIDRKSN